jgi:hypothetical protein
MSEPRPNASADDQAIAEMCAWLKKNQLVAVVSRSGKLQLIPAKLYKE